MEKALKYKRVEKLKEIFASSKMVIITQDNGLSVIEDRMLRAGCRKASCNYIVTKNSFVRIAIANTDFESLGTFTKGPTAILYSDDPIAPAKALNEFMKKTNKIVIKGGVMEGQLLSSNEIKNLAELPSLDEIRGMMVGFLQVPASKIISMLQAPASQLVRVIDAYAKKS